MLIIVRFVQMAKKMLPCPIIIFLRCVQNLSKLERIGRGSQLVGAMIVNVFAFNLLPNTSSSYIYLSVEKSFRKRKMKRKNS